MTILPKKFVARYPATEIAAIFDFVSILRVAADMSSALDALLAKHGLLQGRWWVLVLLMRQDDLSEKAWCPDLWIFRIVVNS